MPITKQQHLDRTRSPKRILSLDGGGIRGILTLGYLGAIEDLLRGRTGNPNLLLCDYFDLIGGTSTGSIIAAGLACGMKVDDLKRVYLQLGANVFKGGFLDKVMLKGLWTPKFPAEPLREELDKQLGADTTLDS